MTKSIKIQLILTFVVYTLSAQSKHEVDSLLNELSKIDSSKNIIEDSSAIILISYGDKVLTNLASYFLDSTQTSIWSDCQDVFLKKGEIALIIADRIELMPYALLTGVQNCLMEFCKDNPNFIEYYLFAIRRGNRMFTQKYFDWIVSNERKKWPYRKNKKAKGK